jgi:hypothetical protein
MAYADRVLNSTDARFRWTEQSDVVGGFSPICERSNPSIGDSGIPPDWRYSEIWSPAATHSHDYIVNANPKVNQMALVFPGKSKCPSCNAFGVGIKSIYGVVVAHIK